MGIVVNRTKLNPFPIKSASGEFISIDDAVNRPVKKLEISFTPQQDLHGESYPWVGGANKNKFDENGTYEANTYIDNSGNKKKATGNVCNLYTQKIPTTPGLKYTVSGTSSVNAYIRIIMYTENDGFVGRILTTEMVNPSITWTCSENTAYVLVNPDASVSQIQLEQSASATSYVPYANICPITGYKGLNFNLSSPNLYDGVWEYGNISETTGQNSGNSHSFFRSKNYLPIPYGQKLYYYSPFRSGAFRQFFYDENYNFLWRNGETWNTVSGVKNAVYMRFRVSGTYTEEQDSKISMNVPSTDHAFVEHHGETIPVSWQTEAGEAFGGTLDLLTGVLTRTYSKTTVGNINWTMINGVFRANSNYTGGRGQSKCDSYKSVTTNPVASDDMTINFASRYWDSNYRIFIKDSRFSSASAFKTAMADVEIVYLRANPATYQLTPHQVRTLLGSNRLWTDVGTISLDYRAMRSAQNTPLLGMLGNPNVEPIEEVEE